MASANEKVFKTMAYAVMALCQVTGTFSPEYLFVPLVCRRRSPKAARLQHVFCPSIFLVRSSQSLGITARTDASTDVPGTLRRLLLLVSSVSSFRWACSPCGLSRKTLPTAYVFPSQASSRCLSASESP